MIIEQTIIDGFFQIAAEFFRKLCKDSQDYDTIFLQMEKTGLLATQRGTGKVQIVLSTDDKHVICLQLNIKHNTVTIVSFSRGYFNFLQNHFLDITV